MPFLNNRITPLWLLVALYLSGCATTTTQPKPMSTLKPSVLHKQHMAQMANIQQFSLRGRLGVKTAPKSFSARLSWQHAAEVDNIDVYSPLGGKVAHITKTPESVIFTDNNKKTIEAQTAETLTKNTLGFELPLSGLSHWALGRTVNKGIVNAITWNRDGSVNTLQQNGWDIQYKDYMTSGAYLLPRKIILKNKKITLKLLVEKWADIK